VFTEKCSQRYIRTEAVREIELRTIKATAAYVRENEIARCNCPTGLSPFG
jgi:hypothetical protein